MLRPTVFTDGFVDNVFDDFFNDAFWRGTEINSVNKMKTDIQDLGESYLIEMELPGFAKEDVRAELKNGYLTVRAARSAQSENKNKKYIRKERYSGHYQRSFYVGEKITQDDISARFKDGILILTVPKHTKQPEAEESRFISIE
ncbi:MAG: Hsp20/alpha crystallin family protein [Clostridiales bacterium]|nr:Hsp20/alpha crystallin family protein [Clostridiales bacterium]